MPEMIIFKLAKALNEHLTDTQKSGSKIGFVPTMGALHEGHISLIHTSKIENDLTVCSIFVNPTQFNNPEDFRLYPVTIEEDIEKLIAAGCDVLFLPGVPEMYPGNWVKKLYALGAIETILEGFHRPGHFQGVCQVVDRLLEIVHPDKLYLGQKDFQQCMVIQKLLEITGKNQTIQLVINPTIREKDGLAMSSRNLRLNQEEKALATSIYNELCTIKARISKEPIDLLKMHAAEHLKEKGFSIDYVEISKVSNLESASDNQEQLVALVAASIGQIRLIDNMILN
jgi:pantoate--beta-alanine ligase